MFNSFFYIVSYIIIFSSFFYFPKKTDKQLNGINWIGISIILIMCFQVIISAFINIFGIPINLISLGIINLVFGVIMWIYIIKNNTFQSYSFELINIIFLIILVILVMSLGFWQFGPHLNIRYETSDPAMHLQFAREIINSQKVSGMFFSPLTNAIILQIAAPFINISKLYKAFIGIDIVMLFLSGFIFYISISRLMKNSFTKIFGIIITFLYILGYPLNNMVFGFFYLGLGVTLINSLLYLFDCYNNKEIDKNLNIVFIGIIMTGVILCYSLFAPIVFISVFLLLILQFKKENQLWKRNFFITIGVTILLPGLIGLYYGYFNYFPEQSTSPLQAIQFEGYIYRDLFSSFVVPLPFAIYGGTQIIKSRQKNLAVTIAPILFCLMLILLFAGLSGKVSSYYFYKNHYLMWMIVFYLLMYGLFILSQQLKSLIIIYSSIWFIIALLNFTGLEFKINQRNVLFEPSIKSSAYFEIYNFNRSILNTRPFYDHNKVNLYEYTYTNILSQMDNNVRIPFAGDWLDCYWYEAITNQIGNTMRYWLVGEEKFLEYINKGELGNYIVVLYNSELYEKYQDYFNKLDRIYENPAGFIGVN